MPENNEYDAIVVGSGISGGWAAKELTEKGLKVLLLERGRDVKHGVDYKNANKDPWEYPHRGGRTQEMIRNYTVARKKYTHEEKDTLFALCDMVEEQEEEQEEQEEEKRGESSRKWLGKRFLNRESKRRVEDWG